MAKDEKVNAGQKLTSFLANRVKIFVTVLVVLVVLIVAYAIGVTINSKNNEKGLNAIDSISYVLTKDSSDLSEGELETRRQVALQDLAEYTGKSGIVGIRANMLAGEIYYSKSDFENSAKSWNLAANNGKNKYTAPLCYFNAGVSYENINDLENAEKCYQNACESKDFLMSAHAEFSLGRVREAKGDVEGALAAYKSLNDKSPDSSWGNLAKSRILALDVE